MGLITSSGIGSGIDVDSIIKAIVNAEKQPKTFAYDRREAATIATLSGIGSLKAAMSELKTSLFNLNSTTAFDQRTASSSDTAVATISANINATPGSFSLTVDAIAQGSDVSTGTFTASTDTVGTGDLTFTAGGSTFTVAIEGSDTLEDIRNAINNSTENFGVNANIINSDAGTILTFTSTVTGVGNDLAITNSDASLDSISTVANAGGAGGASVTQSSGSAQITLEGQTITSTSNTFEDAVQDTTITIDPDSTIGDTATLTVALDTSSVKANVEGFVSTFNSFIAVTDELQNPDLDAPGILVGDSTLRTIVNQLRSDLGTSVSEVSGEYNTLASLGITTTDTGTLEIDSAALDTAISENFDDLGVLFASTTGVANVLTNRINEYTQSSGILSARENTLNDQLERISQSRVDLNFRLDKMETTLRRKFGAMDLIVAQFSATGDFLTQQLSNLPGFTRDNK